MTNITQFGAFVDLGGKENGLIHISQMAMNLFQTARGWKWGKKWKQKSLKLIAQKEIALSLKSDAEVNRDGGSKNALIEIVHTGEINQIVPINIIVVETISLNKRQKEITHLQGSKDLI